MSDLPVEPESAEPAEPEEPSEALASRSRDLLGRADSPIRKRLTELRTDIKQGFENQKDRADTQAECWDAFNCVLRDELQNYRGDSQIYVPIVRDAVNARATRFVNQLFPQGGRYVEAVSSDGSIPNAIVALLDHYIRARRLKTQVAKALCRNGDMEGQYNLYMDWSAVVRQIVSRETKKPTIDLAGTEVEGPGDEFEDIDEEEIIEGAPIFEVLHDSDVLILPTTADTVEEALCAGGSVTVVRHWSKSKLDQMADQGEIVESVAKELQKQMQALRDGEEPKNIEKMLNEHVGIRNKGSTVTVWHTWTMLPLKAGKDGVKFDEKNGDNRLCHVFFGPEGFDLAARRNPYWNDRCPLLSVPLEKVAGVAKGKSQVEPCLSLQYEANDAANEGADAATLAAAPIIRRNPDTSRGGGAPLVFSMGAIWEQAPQDVDIIEFPDLTPRALTRIQYCTQAIFQTLGINPAMLPQQTRAGKPSQAQVAQEQQVDILTTAEATSVLEEGIFTPAMGWAVDLDYQFRDRPLSVRAYGDMGLRAELEDVPPLQNRSRFEFRWWGVEQARNIAQMQIQNQWLNIAMQPAMTQALAAEGKKISPASVLEASAAAVFGSRMAPTVIQDMRSQMAINAELETELMIDGHQLHTSPFDDDAQHIKMHAQAVQQSGDPHGTLRAHIQEHLRSIQMKTIAQQQQALNQAGGQGGQPQGQPGGRRPPQPGGNPAGPRLLKPPAGAIHPDSMNSAGAVAMPRRA